MDTGVVRNEREQRVYEEVLALWRELYGREAPTARTSEALLRMITTGPAAPDYTRLHSPHLRRSSVTFPAPARRPTGSRSG